MILGDILTHKHQWLNTLFSGWDMGITGADRTLHVAPLYHSAQSAVIGVPDPKFGQVIKAFVVPAGELTAQGVRDYCRQGGRLASFKQPRQIQLVAEIPTNPSGKVLKRELRALDS